MPWLVVVVGAAMMVSLFLIALGTLIPQRRPGLPLTDPPGAPLLPPAVGQPAQQEPFPVASGGPMVPDSPTPVTGG
ncbi:hypothetical protein ACFQ0D_22605, partial [Micromonospora zhanjiangensis]